MGISSTGIFAVRERLGYDARAAGAEVLAPGEHDQIGAVSWATATMSSAGTPSRRSSADAVVRGGDVAAEELSLPGRCCVRVVIGERGHGGGGVDVQDEDLQLASVRELDRVLERLRALAGSFERHEDAGELRRRCGRGVARRRPALCTRVMTSSAVCPAGCGPPCTPRAPSTSAATSGSCGGGHDLLDCASR